MCEELLGDVSTGRRVASRDGPIAVSLASCKGTVVDSTARGTAVNTE